MQEEKLRVAVLSVHSSPIGELGTNDTGGMSVCIREIARELGARDHLVDIFTRLRHHESKQRLQLYKNVRLVHLRAGNVGHMGKLATYPYLKDFFEELETFTKHDGIRYNLVHSHYWLSGRVGNWAGHNWGVPHMITFHTLGAAKNNTSGVEQEPALRVAAEKELTNACQRILAGTDTEKDQLVFYYGAASNSIGVVPCGVNLNLFYPVKKSKARLQLNYDNDELLLLYVGRFVPSKGLDRLLAAMAQLRNFRRARLLVVGGDDHHSTQFQDLRKLSLDLEIHDRVTFMGTVEQAKLTTYYSAADILVIPSRYESFGLVALESLACGTPVVSTRVGAMAQILQEGVTGHVVQNGSPRLLAEGIKTLIRGANLPTADVIRGSVLRFGWSNVASKMVEEYKTVVEGHGVALS